VKALIGAPEDREPAVRKLVEEAGGKVISFYMTIGETDFVLISEASGAGTISHVSTVRAWTAAEFKEVAERAGKVASAYRPPGKHRSRSRLPQKLRQLGNIAAILRASSRPVICSAF
jgi:uncharacterized protein with GYD domain